MKRLVLSSYLMVSVLLGIYAQEKGEGENSYGLFKDVYYDAIAQFDETSGIVEDSLNKSPDILPHWFTRSLVREKKQFIPGLSYPGLPDSLANKQAHIHALLLHALLNEALYFDMHDYFMNVEDHQDEYSKFNKITEFKAGFTFNSANFRAVENHTTRFGEKIILYEVNKDSLPTKACDSIGVSGFIFVTELQKNDRYQNEFLIDYNSIYYENDSISDSCRYKTIGVGKLREIKSFMNGEEIAFPFQYYKYKSSCETKPDTLQSSKLYYGLWNALITDVLLKLPSYAKNNDVMISGAGDNYKQQKNIILNRQLTDYRLKARLNSIVISGNDLSTNLQIIK